MARTKTIIGAAACATIAAIFAGVTLHPDALPKPAMSTPAEAAPRPAPTSVAARAKAPEATSRAPAPQPAADDGLTLKRVLDTGGPIRYGDWFWDDHGVPKGPTIITVDLAAKTLSIFRDGYEIGTTAIIYGNDGTPTPLGTFPILQKDADHVSNIYKGAPMPYMLRMTNDGISIHGAEQIAGIYATHGCIGVPIAFARKLFGATRLGDRVVVTNGKVLGASSPQA